MPLTPEVGLLEDQLRTAGESDLADSLAVIRNNLDAWWSPTFLWWFTDHGPSHAARVAEYAIELGTKRPMPEDAALTPLEKYILVAAALAHDIGMQRTRQTITAEEAAEVRKLHPEKARDFILAGDFGLGLPANDVVLIEAVALVANSHGTDYYTRVIEQLGEKRSVRNSDVRVSLLAALLLFADELDLHYQRVIPLPANVEPDVESSAHWLKHDAVNKVRLVIGNTGQLEIHLELIGATNLTDEYRSEIQKWIVTKLQMQIALTEEQITNGFKGYFFISRRIHCTWMPIMSEFPRATEPVMNYIRAENRQTATINHRDCQRNAARSLKAGESVRLVGALSPEGGDLSGREDIWSSVRAAVRASGMTTISSERPDSEFGVLTAADVFDQLCLDAGIFVQPGLDVADDPTPLSVLRPLLDEWLAVQPEPCCVCVSSVDLVSPESRAIVTDWLDEISRAGAHVVLTTDDGVSVRPQEAWTDISVGQPVLNEARAFVARYFTSSVAQTLVTAESSYFEVQRQANLGRAELVDAGMTQ